MLGTRQAIWRRLTARCPGHDDRKDSLSIGKGNDGRVLLNCHAGCEVETVVSALGLVMADLFEANTPRKIRATAQQPQKGARKTPSSTVAGHKTAETTGCTLAAYSEAKGLPVPFLQGLGLRDYPYQGQPSVRIPYLTSDGHTACSRFRIALSGDKFRWKSGAKPCLYGLWRLEVETRHVAIVEGESDCQTLWLHDIDAVGLPGATTWREERDAKHFDDIPRIYVVVEGDKGGEAVLRWLANSTIRDRVWLVDLGKHKDPSGLTVLVKANFEEGTLSMKVNKADLHLLFGNETLQVHLNLEGIPGADWTYQIVMKSTGEGSKLRY